MFLVISFILSIIGIIGFITHGYIVSAISGYLAGICMILGMYGYRLEITIRELVIAFLFRFFLISSNAPIFLAWGEAHAFSVFTLGVWSYVVVFLSFKKNKS